MHILRGKPLRMAQKPLPKVAGFQPFACGRISAFANSQAARVAQVAGAAVPLHSFHTLIFDTRGDQRLVHLTMPYWLVRLRSRRHREFRWLGEMTFLDDTEFDAEAIHVSLDEIERNGP